MTDAIILLFAYLIVPVFFLARVWREEGNDLIRWLSEITLAGVYIADVFLTGIWPMTYGYFIRYLFMIGFLIVTFKSYQNVKRRAWFKPLEKKRVILYLVNFSIASIFTWDIILVFNGCLCPSYSVDLDFPLKKGEFCVVHGGSHKVINAHFSVPAQKYALDIIALNRYGFRTNTWSPTQADDFTIYGSTVYSPCDGIIVDALDLYQDLEPSQMDPEHPAGNYLVIGKKNSDVLVILAHLMPGSLTVKQGDVVLTGQPLARVGNSGNTSEPHLHIHSVLSNSGDFLFTGEGIAMKFQDRFLIRNDRICN